MYIKVKNKKIELVEANTFWERFKSLKFVLGPLDYGIRFPNKNKGNTNFFFENVDVILTDENEKIIHLINGIGTEKKIRKKKKAKNLYFVPMDTVINLNLGEKLDLVVLKKDIEKRNLLEEKRKNRFGFFRKNKDN